MKNPKVVLNSRYIAIAIAAAVVVVFILVYPPFRTVFRTGAQQPAVSRDTGLVGPAEMEPLTFRDANGQLVDVSKQKGKVVIINFWATWCPPCIAEMPTINRMYLHFKANPAVLVLPVDVDGDLRTSAAFMNKNNYSLDAYAPASAIPDDLMSGAIPTTVIIDKKGKVVARHEGGADYSSAAFYQYIERLLAAR